MLLKKLVSCCYGVVNNHDWNEYNIVVKVTLKTLPGILNNN